MFYAQFVLAKKGPLARIWLAAHWDKKLTKAHVFETNIEKSVEGIISPKVKMALRTSGHLLLGVVRIYSRKAKYLLADCNEAFVKIKMAFRPGMVDLPDDNREAAVRAITLPEVFHDFDTPMAELNDVDIQAQFTLNQSSAAQITISEEYDNALLVPTEGNSFGMSYSYGEVSCARDGSEIDSIIAQPCTPLGGTEQTSKIDFDNEPLRNDGFGGSIGDHQILFETENYFDPNIDHPSLPNASIQEEPLHQLDHQLEDINTSMEEALVDHQEHQEQEQPPTPPQQPPTLEPPPEETVPMAPAVEAAPVEEAEAPPPFPEAPPPMDESDDDDDGCEMDTFGGRASVSPASSENGSRPVTPAPPDVAEEMPPPPPVAPVEEEASEVPAPVPEEPPATPVASTSATEQTVLLQDDAEGFTLQPVEANTVKAGFPRSKPRKRILVVDDVKNISGEEMKAQLSDTTDIVNTLDLAPPTKRLMHWKETGGVEKLFALPGRTIAATFLAARYQRQLISESVANEDFGMAGDAELENLSLEQVRDAAPPTPAPAPPKPRGRPKRRQDSPSPASPPSPPAKRPRMSSDACDDVDRDAPFSPPPAAPLDQTPAAPAPRPDMEQSFNQLVAETAAEPMQVDEVPAVETDVSVPALAPAEDLSIALPQDSSVPPADSSQVPEAGVAEAAVSMEAGAVRQLETPQLQESVPPPGEPVPEQELPPEQPMEVDEAPQPVEQPQQSSEQPQQPLEQPEQPIEQAQQPCEEAPQPFEQAPQPFEQPQQPFEEAPQQPPEDDGSRSVREAMLPHFAMPEMQHAEADEQAQQQADEEQGENETQEEFEERVVKGRAAETFRKVARRLKAEGEVSFNALTSGCSRKQVVKHFYTMLVLKKQQMVQLEQAGCYQDIRISKGERFHKAKA